MFLTFHFRHRDGGACVLAVNSERQLQKSRCRGRLVDQVNCYYTETDGMLLGARLSTLEWKSSFW